MTEDSAPCPKRFKKDVKGEECPESWSLTKIVVLNTRHTWTIQNFSLCFETVGEKLISPSFSLGLGADKTEWRLHLFPKGIIKESSDWVSLFLRQLTANTYREFKVKYKFGIVNAMGVDVNVISVSQIKNPISVPGGCNKFVKRDLLFGEENAMLSDDKLTVFCEITAEVNRKNFSGIFTAPQSHLVEDLAFLLESEELSDVTLYAKGKEFRAHKIILTARSPVFRNMFRHDMKKNIINGLIINDIDKEGLGEMLRFMYTGKIQNLKERAPSLLGIAEKYAMADLKSACEKALSENLTIENAVKTFILSDTFRAEQLKIHIKKFIAAHASDVGATFEFEAMVRTHPHLGVEAFRALRD